MTPCFPGVACTSFLPGEDPTGRKRKFGCAPCPAGYAGNGVECFPCPIKARRRANLRQPAAPSPEGADRTLPTPPCGPLSPPQASIPTASFVGDTVPRSLLVQLFGAASPIVESSGHQCNPNEGLSFEWTGESVGPQGRRYALGFDQQAFGRTLQLPPRFLQTGVASRFRVRVCYTSNPQARRPPAQRSPPRAASGERAMKVRAVSSLLSAPQESLCGEASKYFTAVP